ncbi:MAG: TetR/AcrR family transcriptional regulator [Spirochaetales bacterium]|nr:TetR/AcrR family transcriptional regulator [Spirochaetales bacterium]
MKRQKQIDESKDMIASSLARLLNDNDFDDITLSEIADFAGVNRMTIYRHFKSKEKILLYGAHKTLREQEARSAGKSMPNQELIYERLEWISKLPQLPFLLRSKKIDELLDSFRIERHRKALEQATGIPYSENPQLYQFYFGGINRIVQEWLRGRCRESSREISEKIISITKTFIQSNRRE